MRIGVPKETAQGERRVALVPDVVRKLTGQGHEVVLEPGAGTQAGIPDRVFEDGRRDARLRRVGGRCGGQGRAAVGRGGRAARARVGAGGLSGAADERRGDARAGGQRGDGVRDGGDSADLARAVDGRVVVAGDGQRLFGRADRRAGDAALLPDADDRRGDDPAGAGARPGRGCGRVAGDRDGAAAGCGGDGVRCAVGGEGADPVAGGEVLRGRGDRRGGGGGRLCARADRPRSRRSSARRSPCRWASPT